MNDFWNRKKDVWEKRLLQSERKEQCRKRNVERTDIAQLPGAACATADLMLFRASVMNSWKLQHDQGTPAGREDPPLVLAGTRTSIVLYIIYSSLEL